MGRAAMPIAKLRSNQTYNKSSLSNSNGICSSNRIRRWIIMDSAKNCATSLLSSNTCSPYSFRIANQERVRKNLAQSKYRPMIHDSKFLQERQSGRVR